MTRSLYEVCPTNGAAFAVDATHALALPGVTCGVCSRTWAVTGVAYPGISTSVIDFVKRDLRPAVASVEEFRRIQHVVARELQGAYLPPGTELGPLHGVAEGQASTFEWLDPWTLLLRSDVVPDLVRRGITFTAVPARLTFAAPSGATLSELQIEPIARLADDPATRSFERCLECGYVGAQRTDSIVIAGDTVSEEVDLMRLRELPTVIVASERFVDAALAIGCTNLHFCKVDVR
jgi:uncharacterized double-CXXCG motif protein